MLFNSFNFLVFFPLVTALYFVLPHAFRWFMLLVASCVFYMFFIPKYILILFFTIGIDYVAGILIEKETDRRKRKMWLVMSLVANIGILAFFKYYNFFITNVDSIVHAIGWNYSLPLLEIILPIGLSFHTFQAMSYTIEVYRGNQKAERHLGIYALYVMYYPQLVAGPIERPQNLLWQFHAKHAFDYSRVTNGLKLMAWGFFKKVVVADRLSEYVNRTYNHPDEYNGIALLVATIFFSIQIYCDFSGYSDIAIGASEVMGIKLMRNFNRPYFAKTIAEFWNRWHISLSTWFKDYFYIPLGGNREGEMKMYRNLFLTFLISGFWHGANWTFVVWGALHAFYLIVGMLTSKIRANIRKAIGLSRFVFFNKAIQCATVFFLVSFAWIFFRARDLQSAWHIIRKIGVDVPHYFFRMLTNRHFLWLEPLILNRDYHIAWFEFASMLLGIAILFKVDAMQRAGGLRDRLAQKVFPVRWMAYFGLLFLIIFFGIYHDNNEFIYFQF